MEDHPTRPQPSTLLAVVRHPVLVVGLTAALAAAGWALASARTPRYQATAEVLLSDPTRSVVVDAGARIDNERHLRNEVTRMASQEVAVLAAARMGDGTTAAQVRGATEPIALSELDVIRIVGESGDPQRAAALATALGEAYQDVLQRNQREQVVAAQAELASQLTDVQARVSELNGQIAQIEAAVQQEVAGLASLVSPAVEVERRLSTDSAHQALVTERDLLLAQGAQIRGRAQELALDLATASVGVDVFEPAEVPSDPSGPGPALVAALGGLVGLLGGVGLATYRESTSGRVEDRRAAEALLGAPLLGSTVRRLPWDADRLPTITIPGSTEADAYHSIVAVLDFALREHDALTVLVSSAAAADGKTTTTANIAAAAAGDGRDVIVVDADERTAGVTALLGVRPPRPLPDLADPATAVDEVCAVVPLPEGRRLRVVAVPTQDHGTGLLRTQRFELAVDRLIEESGADLILFDAPPFAATSDAAALALVVDACLLVVRRRTPLRQLLEVRRHVGLTGLPQLGYVFTFDRRRPLRRRRAYGRYYAPRTSRGGGRPASRPLSSTVPRA